LSQVRHLDELVGPARQLPEKEELLGTREVISTTTNRECVAYYALAQAGINAHEARTRAQPWRFR